MEGYQGLGCNRMSCPDDCSDHGECVSMRQNGQRLDKGLQQSPYWSYAKAWDADMIHGCSCDKGYTGFNCAEAVCPKGDDPLTINQDDELQLLRCDLDPATTTGNKFTLSFRGATTRPFSASASAAEVRKLLQDLPTVGGVSVIYGRGTTFCNADFGASSSSSPFVPASGNPIKIEFLTEHGELPSIIVLNERGGALSGVYDNNVAVAVHGDLLTYSSDSGALTVASKTGTKESLPCSGRGTCDSTTGDCTCFPGFVSSDGKGNAGTMGDCGYPQLPVTSCPGFPNECSGHGSCSGAPNYKCTCDNGWGGGDCAQRMCPEGPAWFDYPSGPNAAHAPAECSNKGECNRKTGRCECQRMFEGAACERMTCPGSDSPYGACNGHGRCMSMSDLATYARTNGDVTPFVYGADPNNLATWDGPQVFGCFCDKGWTGYDCSQRKCPVGEDITLLEAHPTLQDETQALHCQLLSSSRNPTFRLSFRGDATGPIPYNADPETVKAALEELESIEAIDVTYDVRAGTGAAVTEACTAAPGTRINFKFRTQHGDVPPIQVLLDENSMTAAGGYASGDGWTDTDLSMSGGDAMKAYRCSGFDPVTDFRCFYTYIKTPPAGYPGSGVRTLEVIKGNTVEDECSGRGICDRGTGTCQCFAGFGSSDGMRGPGKREDCGWREPYNLPNQK